MMIPSTTLIYRKIINLIFPKGDVLTFTNPEKALLYFNSIYAYSLGKTTMKEKRYH